MSCTTNTPRSISSVNPLEALMFDHSISLLRTALALATTGEESDDYSRSLGLLLGVEEVAR